MSYLFEQIGRLPLPGDNVAIATQRLEAGTVIQYGEDRITLDYTVLEGHRFAIRDIEKGGQLLSWELPFGVALRPIAPGNYVINDAALLELKVRSLQMALPEQPNFSDWIMPYTIDESQFRPAPELPPYEHDRTFMGFRRPGRRGVGTRNKIVLLGTTSHTGSYVRQLADRLQDSLAAYPGVDGIVPVAHTEGGAGRPNNLGLLLRTLAGFMVNPNVGAVLVVDTATEQVTNALLEDYMTKHQYPLGDVMHRFMTLGGGFEEQLAAGEAIVREWLPVVHDYVRTPESIRHLRIGLQCGGSDAFSGISANPLLGWVLRELVRYGGSANLAETDELIAAEPYVLQKVRDLNTAQRFLALIDQFRERTSWHGASAEGNPSGGNKYRGLYNIALKSIGAAQKKDPLSRLDYTIDYGQPMTDGGFYFMDSPGNDLESIAGQVASGCNLIFFATGNGSITNFPFVPTIKVVTTTRRYELLADDMDVNAGQYQDGKPMDELGAETFELALRIASGQLSVGERAGHSQVQIWRDWQQTDGSRLEEVLRTPQPTGAALDIATVPATGISADMRFTFTRTDGGRASDRVGLIVPTSLCAGQVARMIVGELNESGLGMPERVSRYVTLPHTEGCGNSGGTAEQLYARTMVGYVLHPMVRHCLLLEHGCEKTHNDYMRQQIERLGGDPGQVGYASIQLDGGIDKVKLKVEDWFRRQVPAGAPGMPEQTGLEGLRIGLMSDGSMSELAAEQFAALTGMIVGAGGIVVVPANSGLLAATGYSSRLGLAPEMQPSLAYGEHVRQNGFHIMETPTAHWVESMTGLAATGVELIIALVQQRPMQTHPFVPVLQATADMRLQREYADDLDLLLTGDSADWSGELLGMTKRVIEQQYTPRLFRQGNIDFQFTRGLLGVSL